jgi:hypothetical protein
MCDFPAINLKLALTPRRDFHLELIAAYGSDKLLQGRALSDGQRLIRTIPAFLTLPVRS